MYNDKLHLVKLISNYIMHEVYALTLHSYTLKCRKSIYFLLSEIIEFVWLIKNIKQHKTVDKAYNKTG